MGVHLSEHQSDFQSSSLSNDVSGSEPSDTSGNAAIQEPDSDEDEKERPIFMSPLKKRWNCSTVDTNDSDDGDVSSSMQRDIDKMMSVSPFTAFTGYERRCVSGVNNQTRDR